MSPESSAGGEQTESGGMPWFVVKAAVGFEKGAREYLKTKIEESGFRENFGPEILMPVENVLTVGTKKTTEKKLYPGYLFIQIRTDGEGRMDDRCWHLVRRARKISGFISGASDAPIPLSDKEIGKIRRQMAELGGREPSLKARFAMGDTVRVKEGPFVDFTGTVENVNVERSRLKVLVMVLGRATPVELDFNQVDKA